MVTDVSPLQLEKAPPPIEVIESGMVIVVKLLQFWKAELPIVVTESGMVRLPVSPLSLKA